MSNTSEKAKSNASQSLNDELFDCTDSQADQDRSNESQDSLKVKLVILISMLIMPVGCHYMEATLSTLKTTLKQNMSINNTQFSILMTSVTLVNTILPLFTGVFADDINWIGTVRGTLIVNIIIFIGSLMVTIGANYLNYPIMVAGQVIYGLGDGVIVTFQEAVLSRWFRHKQLSIVVGCMLSMARLTKFVAKLTCYPLVNASGTFQRPITVAVIFCGISILANVTYWLAMWKAGYATVTGRELSKPGSSYGIEIKNAKHGTAFRFSYSVLLYLPGIFWMVPWMQLTMSSVLSSFEDIATEYVQLRFTTSSVMAGIQSSLTQAVPIIAAPLLGLYVHRFGKTLYILIGGTFFLVLSMVLLGYTWSPPAVGMILYSFALSFGSVALLSSASLLLPVELAGLGVGIHKCANNIGTTIVSVIVGYVQDLTYHDNDPYDNTTDLRYEYNGVMVLYLSLACFACLLAFLFWFWDRHTLDGWLQVNRKEREARLVLAGQQSQKQKQYVCHDQYQYTYSSERAFQLVGSQLLTKPCYVYVGFFGFWLIVSWAIFFTFALMPVYQCYSL